MQLITVILLVALFIIYNSISTNVTNTSIEMKEIDLSINLKTESLPAHYSTSTQQLTIEKEVTVEGFVISSSFWEQQVGAALNLWTLSKWATTVGAYPVEPFVVNSKFVLPKTLSQSNLSEFLRFRNYFNLKLWNRICSDLKLMPLISWEEFLCAKSKQLIVAVVLLDTDRKRDVNCSKQLQKFLYSISSFSRQMNFVVVKKVCFVFSGQGMYLHDFNAKLYGEFNPKQVTVWFSMWPGVNRYRIYFKEVQYWRNPQSMHSIHPSESIIADSRNYVHKYIGSDFGQYVAVSFRSVKRAKKFQLAKISQEIQNKFFDTCIKKLGEKLEELRSNQNVFLSVDLGNFGDKSAKNYMSSGLIDRLLNSTIRIVYKNKTTVQEYERSFVTATNGIADDGYIAAVQRTIVENSKCLVMFGGNSNFQRSILFNYVDGHKSPCVVKVCYID